MAHLTSIEDLTQAYRRTKLRHLGISLLDALSNPALVICLNRIASNAAKRGKGKQPPSRLQRED